MTELIPSNTPPRWSSLAKTAFGAALAAGALTAGQAQALVVNVGGQDYDVTTFTGSYNDNVSKFETPANGGVMPWWGSYSTAGMFSSALGNQLGLPNSEGIPEGPYFAYQIILPGNPFAISYRTTDSTGYTGGNNIQFTTSRIWARASMVNSQAAPGPLPVLGAAAAFGFSRQLRKRIKGSSNTVPNTYTL